MVIVITEHLVAYNLTLSPVGELASVLAMVTPSKEVVSEHEPAIPSEQSINMLLPSVSVEDAPGELGLSLCQTFIVYDITAGSEGVTGSELSFPAWAPACR
jgi:hypothetical protein